jgi:DNA-binding response OmpR family regulator
MQNLGLSVLIVDDSSGIRERVAEMLRATGGVTAIAEASTVADAHRAMVTQIVDVIILDIALSDGNGIDLLQDIRRSSATPYIIMLTNCTSTPYRARCREYGANLFLDKSTEFESLPVIVARLARKAGAAQ